MDQTQADAAAEVLLQPGRQARDEARRRRHLQARKLAMQRLVARFAVLGLVAGAAVAYFAHKNVLAFTGFGGASGIVIGGLVASWRGSVSRTDGAPKPGRPRGSSNK